MKVAQHELDRVDLKLNKQNAFLAALGGAFWTMPILFAWFFVFQNFPKFAPLMLVLSGILIGIAVRLHGRGYSCLLYTSPSPRDRQKSRMPSSA